MLKEETLSLNMSVIELILKKVIDKVKFLNYFMMQIRSELVNWERKRMERVSLLLLIRKEQTKWTTLTFYGQNHTV